jgi:ABC-type Na+ efflux pump permease subunit
MHSGVIGVSGLLKQGGNRMDIITLVNLILGIIIFGLGVWAYSRKKGDVPLYIGIAFLLFAISHLIALIGLAAGLTVFLIIIRLIAYLLVILALYKIATKK